MWDIDVMGGGGGGGEIVGVGGGGGGGGGCGDMAGVEGGDVASICVRGGRLADRRYQKRGGRPIPYAAYY